MTPPPRAPLVRALVALLVLTALAHGHARFEWRDVVQDVRILPDGGVEVRDERTLWTDEDFGEAFVCVRLRAGETLTLLPGETGAISPGPPAEGRTQSCTGGTEVFVRQEARVRERRVRFAYRLDGVVDVYSDVVQWYWNILERAPDRPVVLGYRLRVTAPGPMAEPFDAFVMRYANPEQPTVELSADRRVLDVSFRRIPPNDGVEIRYLMDPALFDEQGTRAGLAGLLEDQLRVVREGERARFWRSVRSHPAWALLPAAGLAHLVMGILAAYRRSGREPTVEAMRYPFEPPRDMPPAAAATVMRQDVPATSLGPAWFATIMDLARRGFLRFEGEGRRLVIHLEDEPTGDSLEAFERAVLTYLRSAAGSGRSGRRDPNSVTIAELSSYGQRNAQRFLSSFGRQVKAWAEGYYGGPYLTPESLKARNRWTLRSVARRPGHRRGDLRHERPGDGAVDRRRRRVLRAAARRRRHAAGLDPGDGPRARRLEGLQAHAHRLHEDEGRAAGLLHAVGPLLRLRCGARAWPSATCARCNAPHRPPAWTNAPWPPAAPGWAWRARATSVRCRARSPDSRARWHAPGRRRRPAARRRAAAAAAAADRPADAEGSTTPSPGRAPGYAEGVLRASGLRKTYHTPAGDVHALRAFDHAFTPGSGHRRPGAVRFGQVDPPEPARRLRRAERGRGVARRRRGPPTSRSPGAPVCGCGASASCSRASTSWPSSAPCRTSRCPWAWPA
jgi:hypothetical protein